MAGGGTGSAEGTVPGQARGETKCGQLPGARCRSVTFREALSVFRGLLSRHRALPLASRELPDELYAQERAVLAEASVGPKFLVSHPPALKPLGSRSLRFDHRLGGWGGELRDWTRTEAPVRGPG